MAFVLTVLVLFFQFMIAATGDLSTAQAQSCGSAVSDMDGDGVPDAQDLCPTDQGKVVPGACGCGTADWDGDGDAAAALCGDACPGDSGKRLPGICGCGTADTDTDCDSVFDCMDVCPADPTKSAPGVCGCGIPDTDTDGDGEADCQDGCPNDFAKTTPGSCGCEVPDVDSDGDGTPDFCGDQCPQDAAKLSSGVCGCGISDADDDGDGAPDFCGDECPGDATLTSAGICGCGVVEIDRDGDGIPDCGQDPNQPPMCPRKGDLSVPHVAPLNYQEEQEIALSLCNDFEIPAESIAQLGSPKFRERDAESKALTARIAAYIQYESPRTECALEKVRRSLKSVISTDPEVEERVKKLLLEMESNNARNKNDVRLEIYGKERKHYLGSEVYRPDRYVAEYKAIEQVRLNGCNVTKVRCFQENEARKEDWAFPPEQDLYVCSAYSDNCRACSPSTDGWRTTVLPFCLTFSWGSVERLTPYWCRIESPLVYDGCPNDPDKTDSGICGCGLADTDLDGNGYADCLDSCRYEFNFAEKQVCS